MTGLSIMRLLPRGGSIVGGSVKLSGREMTTLSTGEMRRVRGNDVAMVFQDPMTSLNPTMTVGEQIAEPVRIHLGASRAAARERAAEVLDLVGDAKTEGAARGISPPLSGGLRQRVMIALALACRPKLLIADEPTTALDVTIQAQILALLEDLKSRLSMGLLLITHDLGVVAGRADRVMVMYAGRIVEAASTAEIFDRMRHPYTQALLEWSSRRSRPIARRRCTAFRACRPTCRIRPPTADSHRGVDMCRRTAGSQIQSWAAKIPITPTRASIRSAVTRLTALVPMARP